MADRSMKLAVLLSAVDKLSGPMGKMLGRTQEVGGASKKLEAELAKVHGQQAQVDAFRRLKTQLGDAAAKMRAAQARAAELGKAMRQTAEPTKEQVRQFEAARAQAAKLKDAHADGAKKLEGLRRELHTAGIATKALAEHDRRLKTEAKSLATALEAQAKKLERLDQLSKRSKRMMIGGAAAVGVGVGASALGGRARGAIADTIAPMVRLDDAAAKIRSMPGIAEESVRQLTGAGRAWARGHADSADQYVETSYMMLSAGLDVAQSQVATERAMRVALATMGDSTQVAGTLATLYNNLGDKTADVSTEMGRLGDLLTKTQQTFQFADMAQLNEGLKYATAGALKANVPLEQVLATVGQLNNAGMQGSMAGTAFNASLQKLESGAKKLRVQVAKTADGQLDYIGTIGNLQAKLGDFDKLSLRQRKRVEKALGGEDALRAIVLLSKNLDSLKGGLAAVEDSAGATEKAATAMASAPSQKAKILSNQIDDLKMRFGEHLLPKLLELIPVFERLIDRVSTFVAENPGLTAFVAKFAVIGTVAMTILGPVLKVGGAIWGVGGAALALVTKLRKMQAVGAAAGAGLGSKLGGALKSVGGLFGGMGRAAWTASKALLTTPVGWLITAFAALGATIAYVVTKWRDLTGESNTFAEASPELVKELKNDAKRKAQFIEGAMKGQKDKQLILSQVFGDDEGFDAEFWEQVNRDLKDKKRADLAAQHGVTGPGAAPELPAMPDFEAHDARPFPAPASAAPTAELPELLRQLTKETTKEAKPTISNRFEIIINAAQGQDVRQLATLVMDEIQRRMDAEQRGAMFDGAEAAG